MSITPQKLKEMVAEMAEGPLRTAVTGPLLNALWDAAERIETLEKALRLYYDAVRVDVLMSGPVVCGASIPRLTVAYKNACEVMSKEEKS